MLASLFSHPLHDSHTRTAPPLAVAGLWTIVCLLENLWAMAAFLGRKIFPCCKFLPEFDAKMKQRLFVLTGGSVFFLMVDFSIIADKSKDFRTLGYSYSNGFNALVFGCLFALGQAFWQGIVLALEYPRDENTGEMPDEFSPVCSDDSCLQTITCGLVKVKCFF